MYLQTKWPSEKTQFILWMGRSHNENYMEPTSAPLQKANFVWEDQSRPLCVVYF